MHVYFANETEMQRAVHLRALGLPKDASVVDKGQVKAAYIAASKRYHPDLNHGSNSKLQAENSARFLAAQKAQEWLLSNSAERRWEEAKRTGNARTTSEVYRANQASGPNITPPKLTFKQNIGLRLGVWFFICGLAFHDYLTTKRSHRM
eukprot:gene20446-20440_t